MAAPRAVSVQGYEQRNQSEEDCSDVNLDRNRDRKVRLHGLALWSRRAADQQGLRCRPPRYAFTGVRGSIGPLGAMRSLLPTVSSSHGLSVDPQVA
jgi:hypothetical protein